MKKADGVDEVTWSGYRESELMKLALTHPSCALTKDGAPYNNQRLEFLGDSVLGMVIAEMLYELYPLEQEGDLARRLSALVCGPVLVEIAKRIGLGEAMIISDSEAQHDGRNNPSNLEDACEALIGALYLDGGMEAARQFIYQHWHELAKSIAQAPKDPKTALQEWAQARGLPLPSYTVVREEGPAHAPRFTVRVSVKGHGEAEAEASAKRHAEREAAEILLATLV
jgi:ribonuclease-3